jgi:hypothetical protein
MRAIGGRNRRHRRLQGGGCSPSGRVGGRRVGMLTVGEGQRRTELALPHVLQLASAAAAGLGRARVAGSAPPVAGEGGRAAGEAASRRSTRRRGEEERVEESAWRTPAAAAIA